MARNRGNRLPSGRKFTFGTSFSWATLAFAAGFVMSGAMPAKADAIDGQWCSPSGKSMKIDGPSITTPGGTKMQGTYGRHSFTYVIPPKETDAGKKVYMTLNSEEDLDVHTGSPVAKAVNWKRCQIIS